jgi:hypothetical protein
MRVPETSREPDLMSSSGGRRGERDADDDQPYEDPTLDASESLVTDDLGEDPLDVGVVPPDHYSAAESFGTTAEEARRGESLDQLLAEEEPELEPEEIDEYEEYDEAEDLDDQWDEDPNPRSGLLVADPAGSEELYAEDVGEDTGASPAEEAAIHVVEDEDGI